MRHLLIPFGFKLKPKDESGPRYGDIYERSVAACIDLMLLFFALDWLFSRVQHFFFGQIDQAILASAQEVTNLAAFISILWASKFAFWWLVNAWFQFAIIGIFYVGCQIVYNTTPGRYLLGLKIVQWKDHAQSPTRWQYVVRYLAYIPSCAPLMIGMLWACFNKERRGWHDKIAGTVVLNTRPKGWYWEQVKRGFRYLKTLASK